MSYIRSLGDVRMVADCIHGCAPHLPQDVTGYARCTASCEKLRTVPVTTAPPTDPMPDPSPGRPDPTLMVGAAIAVAILLGLRGKK